jgi:hypothetical protein
MNPRNETIMPKIIALHLLCFLALFTSCGAGTAGATDGGCGPTDGISGLGVARLAVEDNTGSYSRIAVDVNHAFRKNLDPGSNLLAIPCGHIILNFRTSDPDVNLIGYPKEFNVGIKQVLTVSLGPADVPDIGFLTISNKTDSPIVPVIDDVLHEAYTINPATSASIWIPIEEMEPDGLETVQTVHTLNIWVPKYDQLAWDAAQSFRLRGRLDRAAFEVYMSDLELP